MTSLHEFGIVRYYLFDSGATLDILELKKTLYYREQPSMRDSFLSIKTTYLFSDLDTYLERGL
jgi:hypothetical protein